MRQRTENSTVGRGNSHGQRQTRSGFAHDQLLALSALQHKTRDRKPWIPFLTAGYKT